MSKEEVQGESSSRLSILIKLTFSRCDGSRPSCRSCVRLNLNCKFDVPDGALQRDRVKHEYCVLEKRFEKLDTLVATLTTCDDDMAVILLSRMRAGESVQDLVQSLQAPPPLSMEHIAYSEPAIAPLPDICVPLPIYNLAPPLQHYLTIASALEDISTVARIEALELSPKEAEEPRVPSQIMLNLFTPPLLQQRVVSFSPFH
jgi:hypothetical protein